MTKIEYFYGDGVNLTARKVMGTDEYFWNIGDIVEVPEWSEGKGDFTDQYKS